MTVTSTIAATGVTSTSSSSAKSSSSSAGTSSGTSSGGSTDIAGNFTQFLTLLTTQLKNQSPLDPLDTNQFTQQLVQFASVEQQLKTNSTLTTLATGAKAQVAASAAGLVGTTVTVDGSSASFANGGASWSLNAAKASTATISVKDSTGAVVASQTQALGAGSQTFRWDGRALNGNTVATGTFTLAVTARDASGQPVTVTTDTSGQVTSVDVSGDAPVVTVGGISVPLSSVKSIGG